MASAVYAKAVIDGLDLPELLDEAEYVRDATQTPGWQLVAKAIDAHREKQLQRLTNPSTKPEDVRYLQGLVAGLASMSEAAETILATAAEREAEARRQTNAINNLEQIA